ncbi:MAG: class I SAM-dependent methyltransferase [Deltaproteobacteria bacterium]|nr:class I SAM-dependent methyltransferase [Deltaproteobacteria bacterium]
MAQRLDRSRSVKLLEVGCATGEFYRYLCLRYPKVIYCGIDISEPAITRARDKYPKGKVFVGRPEVSIPDTLRDLQLQETYEVAYASDVVLHQIRPFEFISELLSVAAEMVIFKCRTRDVGQTETDPEQSCQYQAHYGTWVPYMVINLDELIAHIRSGAAESEIVVHRNHMILGGQNNRYLPKDCYLKETGTAVAAVGVFLDTDHPGRVSVENRQDGRWSFTLGYRVRHLIYRMRRKVGLAS